MSLISLEGSVLTCKVNTAWANRIQSDRFENPRLMVCPTWNGLDTAGRPVCPDSYMTKRAGCNSALDRVDVENYQRPQYMEYMGLDAAGINGNIYQPNNMLTQNNQQQANFVEDFIPKVTGSFGSNPNYGSNLSSCGHYPYETAQRQQATVMRQQQALNRQTQQYNHNQNSGGY